MDKEVQELDTLKERQNVLWTDDLNLLVVSGECM